MARNPYQPGVGTPPPYLADREAQLRRFANYLDDFPQKRRNLRLSGLRGVGKTVLLKEYRDQARERDWVVVRRDLTARLCNENDFAVATANDLDAAIEAFSNVAKLKSVLSKARAAVGEITLNLGQDVSISVQSKGRSTSPILEDRLRDALLRLGELAAKAKRGVVFLYDKAHELYDRPRKHQFPLSALVGAFVQAQDEDQHSLPLMLVMSGLPPLTQNLQAARSHSERLFRAEELSNLSLERGSQAAPSQAALALTMPAEQTNIRFQSAVAEQIAKDVDGYPYFIQKYGEELWDAADARHMETITAEFYEHTRPQIQSQLDAEFFEGRYLDATRSDQLTLRVAASLGGERFEVAKLVNECMHRSSNATRQSVSRLLKGNQIYRISQGIYGYTAPLFGDFLRRKYPRQADDR